LPQSLHNRHAEAYERLLKAAHATGGLILSSILARRTFFAALGAAGLAISSSAFAADPGPKEALLSVSGTGEAATAPDMAIVDLAVLREADTAREALDANNKAMSDVLAALKKDGIAEKDLQTSGLSIQPKYDYSKNDGSAPTLTGYQVTNSLTVRIRDLAKLGSVLDESVTLGVNQGGGIRFANDKPDALLETARKDAVRNAIAKAKTMAEAAGVKLGRIVEMSEASAPSMPQPMVRMAMAKEMSDASVPVAAGENSYLVTVNVTFALEP
jgi:uncharacterized protein